ncbi:hypothetical protein C7974DRAFT_417792 [Boeremia exigua]|uniref:uncharacterized protein n=1 Tax=Boeremia exigua TaxID=749465 RepID=UPI001E8E23EF|nr:uncharacterized protein C7974DRAFT_417792 [Boeremia exigua]KAH6614052.1 hypothetical protein C7974DRAFT_417792 [Boeremia exigua]
MSLDVASILAIAAALLSLPPSILAIWSLSQHLRGPQTDIEVGSTPGAGPQDSDTIPFRPKDDQAVMLQTLPKIDAVALSTPPKPCLLRTTDTNEQLEYR